MWIEIDTDGHRSGVKPEDDLLLQIGTALHEGGMHLGGVLTHAGSSYDCNTRGPAAPARRTGARRRGPRGRAPARGRPAVPGGQRRLDADGAARRSSLEGVTELRAGVYVFFDLVMHNVGVCSIDDIALSVLTTVIGHQDEKGWAIVDAGWMAMSRDRGTQKQQRDFGYGQVCTEDGEPLGGYLMSGANQEHGIVSRADGADTDIAARFPIGTRLRILPNHACATGAQHPEYHGINCQGEPLSWPRFYGW